MSRLLWLLPLLLLAGVALAQSADPTAASDPLAGLLGASPIAIAIAVTLSRGITIRVVLPDRVSDAIEDGADALATIAQAQAGGALPVRRRARRGNVESSTEPMHTPSMASPGAVA